jgi:parallel beta-helix repeat protein
MTILCRHSVSIASAILLLFLTAGVIHYSQRQFHLFNTAEAGEGGECIDYDGSDNTITINCDASFLDVVQTINDPDVLENRGNGEYILNANLEVADGITFVMTSNQDGIQFLKIAGENGITVYGRILIDGVKITSWNISDDEVILQNINGTIRRGYVRFAGSEGAQIFNSEFGYLGDVEPGRRGFDLLGRGQGASYDMVIRGSKFHDMWMAFFSNGAHNITVEGNEYYNNIKYALDPHTGTYNMTIRSNWLHDNPIGAICSFNCYNILIEGNLIEHNTDYGIFFSRNMHDSIARNNHITDTTSGITVSESPNNQIYNNTIEGATSQGIRLFNPSEPPYDGFTEGNLVYDNRIIDSENGIVAARSHDNVVQNTVFSDIESSEYRLSGNSSMIIRDQHFDNTIISQENSEIDSRVEIVDSGIIEVTQGLIDEDEDEEEDDEGEGGDLFNTDIESYRRVLSDGDDITVNSSSS